MKSCRNLIVVLSGVLGAVIRALLICSTIESAQLNDIRTSQNKLGVTPFTTATLATRFAGSADLFQSNGRRPCNYINSVVEHDGFTLADLYRFNAKNNNQSFPAGPSDGGSDNNLILRSRTRVVSDCRLVGRHLSLVLSYGSVGVCLEIGYDVAHSCT